MAIRIPNAPCGPRLPDVDLNLSEEESAGGEMVASFCACGADLDVPSVLASVRDAGVAGTLSVGRIRMALHAARCTLVINASGLFAALFPFWDCPAYPIISLLYLILSPTRPLRPPAPPSQSATSASCMDVARGHRHHSPSVSRSGVCVARARIAIEGLAMNALELLEELLGVGGIRVRAVHRWGRKRSDGDATCVLLPFLFFSSFLVSCFSHAPLTPTFLSRYGIRRACGTGGYARARLQGMACALGAGLALKIRAGGHNVCADTSGSARRTSLARPRCEWSGSDTYPWSARAVRRSLCAHAHVA
ncbi:hypothetical protein B0H13DRAFT_2651874 [Mycena leptocephala]|nr:hypothetical protein B0H13DRAFT_2651874 [Mycena leptocephala]